MAQRPAVDLPPRPDDGCRHHSGDPGYPAGANPWGAARWSTAPRPAWGPPPYTCRRHRCRPDPPRSPTRQGWCSLSVKRFGVVRRRRLGGSVRPPGTPRRDSRLADYTLAAPGAIRGQYHYRLRGSGSHRCGLQCTTGGHCLRPRSRATPLCPARLRASGCRRHRRLCAGHSVACSGDAVPYH